MWGRGRELKADAERFVERISYMEATINGLWAQSKDTAGKDADPSHADRQDANPRPASPANNWNCCNRYHVKAFHTVCHPSHPLPTRIPNASYLWACTPGRKNVSRHLHENLETLYLLQ